MFTQRKVLGYSTVRWKPRFVQFDADDRFLAIFKSERHLNKPLRIVYNLQMINAVYEVTNDPTKQIFEFAVKIRNQPVHFRAVSNEEMTTWVSVILSGCNLSRMKI